MSLKDLFMGKKKENIFSPLEGTVIQLEEVPDEVFSTKMLGDGIAILGTSSEIYAPCDGVIENLFETKHAFTIVSEKGAEILVHIGIDTVNLKGEGFSFDIETGDTVKAGQKIGTVDFQVIEEAGYNIHTMVVVTNTDSYKHIENTKEATVTSSSVILELEK